jgi:hypothetical protein
VEAESSYVSEIHFADIGTVTSADAAQASGREVTALPLPGTAGLGAVAW